jgi:uncharacterized protein (DUF362 family)/Pyruvate/2-oxoacid:ferredoxin oxidoreductase delta subunit
MPSSIVSCNSYEINEVKRSLDVLLEQIGGLAKYVPNGSTVFMKINLIKAMAPEKAGTTHPSVVEALAEKLIKECNATVIVGDSPGGLYNAQFLGGIYRTTKIGKACERSGAKTNADFGWTEYENPNGVVLKKISVIDALMKADVVINVAKLKTHALTGHTAAVKNLFGVIPGLQKVGLHAQFEDLYTFCDCLIDIEQFLKDKIKLHIIDGVVGMHRDGPAAGDPIQLNRLIASDNAHHADCLGVSVFGNPCVLPTIKQAIKRGLLEEDLSDVPYDLNTIEKNCEFVQVPTLRKHIVAPHFLVRLVGIFTTRKVKINKSKCKGCKVCIEHCPKKTIRLNKNNKAQIKQRNCIRCYCCQELCPFNAVDLKNPPFARKRKQNSDKTKN